MPHEWSFRNPFQLLKGGVVCRSGKSATTAVGDVWGKEAQEKTKVGEFPSREGEFIWYKMV